jgi:hypothetical protein
MSCPFFRPLRGGGAARANTGSDAKPALPWGSPEALLEEYQDGDVLSSTIMYGLGNRSNGGGKVKTRTLHKRKHAAPCRTFVLRLFA